MPRFLNALHQQFLQEIRDGHIILIPLTDSIMIRLETALQLAPTTTFLRAADALHLASAAESGFTEVYSNDRQFLAATPLFGLQGSNVI